MSTDFVAADSKNAVVIQVLNCFGYKTVWTVLKTLVQFGDVDQFQHARVIQTNTPIAHHVNYFARKNILPANHNTEPIVVPIVLIVRYLQLSPDLTQLSLASTQDSRTTPVLNLKLHYFVCY